MEPDNGGKAELRLRGICQTNDGKGALLVREKVVSGEHPTVLVVEDERIVGKDIEQRLKDLGYKTVGIVSTGQKALEKTEQLKPAVVLMDIRLKGEMDGIEAAEIIKSRFQTPVIYITAYADQRTLERAMVTEPFGYLLKPFNERDLRTTIEMALYKHKIEKRLRESQEWLSTTLRSIGDGVVAVDVTGLVTFMNPVAEGMIGVKQEEAIGRELTEMFMLVREDGKPGVANPLAQAIMDGKVKTFSEHSLLVLKDGRRIPVDNSVAPIRDGRGNITGGVLVLRDVSERKQLENQLMHSQEMKVLGQLAAGVAHEVRNPLNAILAITEALFQDIGENKEYQPYLGHIRTQVTRLSELMKDLLELGKPIQHSQMRSESLLDLSVGAINLWKQTAISAANPLFFDPHDGVDKVSVMVDGPRLQQVFINLLENAVQHSPAGSEVLLRIFEPAGGTVRVRISDKGSGIAEDRLEKIFEPFYTTRRGGVGLGLSIVKHLVESMGGMVRVWNNEPPPGSSAEIILPIEFGAKR